MTRTRLALLFMALGIAALGAIVLSLRVSDPCASERGAAQFDCYEHSLAQAEEKSLQDVFSFLHGLLDEHAPVPRMHLLLHDAGHFAYHAYNDPTDALVSFARAFPDWKLNFTLDGFRHGVLMAFFTHQKTLGLQELTRQGCDAYLAMDTGVHASTTIAHCFEELGAQRYSFSHGLGHAFMALESNDAGRALSDCDTLPHGRAQETCGYGVFMELSYLYLPTYGGGTPRPVFPESAFAGYCARVPDAYRVSCARMVGRAYLIVPEHAGDFSGAFAECAKLGSAYRAYCVKDAAAIFMPFTLENDPSRIIAACGASGSEEACIEGAAWGIAQSPAGAPASAPLCEAVPQAMQQSCACAAGTLTTAACASALDAPRAE